MTQETAPPPHSKTVRLAVISIAVTMIFGAIGLFFKVSASNSGIQGQTTLGPGSTGINNGIQNFSFGATTKADQDPELFVECFRGVRTAKFPADGRLYIAALSPGTPTNPAGALESTGVGLALNTRLEEILRLARPAVTSRISMLSRASTCCSCHTSSSEKQLRATTN